MQVAVDEVRSSAALSHEEVVLSGKAIPDSAQVESVCEGAPEQGPKGLHGWHLAGGWGWLRKRQSLISEAEMQPDIHGGLLGQQPGHALGGATLQKHHAGDCAKAFGKGQLEDGIVDIIRQTVVIGTNNHWRYSRKESIN
jgi:hypothetical protein